jgi:adenylate kinase
MRIILMGAPGAGKGTQATVIAEHFGIPHISSGEIFRRNIRANTPLGVAARQYIDRGDYVPDGITNGMIRDRLTEPDAAKGFLLDGYPRTLAQIHNLDETLVELGQHLDSVVEMTADPEAVVHRLLARAEVEGRSDDNDEIIRNRLLVYHQQTAPLTAVYAERGLLVQVDALGTIDQVSERILRAL